MFERFTNQARQVLVVAQEEARLLDSRYIGTDHFLLGLIQDAGGVAGEVLSELGVTLPEARERVQGGAEAIDPRFEGSPQFTPEAKKTLEYSLRESMRLMTDYLGTEHLLLGVLHDEQSRGAQLLLELGVDLVEVREKVTVGLSANPDGRPGAVLRVTPGGRRRAPSQAREVACSFCGLQPPESGRLIEGNDAFICERCIGRWSSRLAGSNPGDRPWISGTPVEQVTPGEPPADSERAREAISEAFARYGDLSDDGSAALGVEGGESLGWAVAEARAKHPSYQDVEIGFTVDEVVFVDPEHAAVWYSLLMHGRTYLSRQRGDAVLIDGEWLMARSTFNQIMALGGVTLPPAD
jgi:hypothetical protein